MRPFAFQRAGDADEALKAAALMRPAADIPQTQASTQFLAGGTTLLDLMKLDVMRPDRLIDINALSRRHSEIITDESELRLGGLARMAEIAEHPLIQRDYPVIAQSLQLAASQQLRNMASLSGNVLQRTRCSTLPE